MADDGMIRVLLVEDHGAFRQALGFMLRREPDISLVGQAGTIAEARTMLEGVDVVILDLNLPDGDGAELIPAIRAHNPQAHILVLTGTAGGGTLDGVTEALQKSAGMAEIVAAVHRVGGGGSA
ncbi:MAG: response regulator transcription factor [Chloroflexi bacterium]|nr:response regulator transcription factor [Chloroflexota bacterium]